MSVGCRIRAVRMNEAPATEAVGVRTGRRPAHGVRRRLRRHSGTITGAAVLSLIALAVLFGSAVHDVDPQYLDYPAKNQGMSLEHPLGTDNSAWAATRWPGCWPAGASPWPSARPRWCCR